MYLKTISYVDFNGEPREEDCYFNLSPAEVYLMSKSKNGGIYEILKKMVKEKDEAGLTQYIKDLLLAAYGVKSNDGRNFRKNSAIREDFESTPAFSELYMLLVCDTDEATKFVNNVLPSEEAMNKYIKMMENSMKKQAEQKTEGVPQIAAKSVE